MNMKKFLILVGVGLLLYYVMSSPDGAANTTETLGATLQQGADSVIRFFNQVTN